MFVYIYIYIYIYCIIAVMLVYPYSDPAFDFLITVRQSFPVTLDEEKSYDVGIKPSLDNG